MSPEKDAALCKKYPKIFAQRKAPMTETAMCWGFEIGDGWYDIIEHLCGNIQWHINQARSSRMLELRFNRALSKALKGDLTELIKHHTYGVLATEQTLKYVQFDLAQPKFRVITPKVSQVVVSQVKEKFGTLRFYYDGGDEYIRGAVDLAESMTGATCEECGAPGKVSDKGWIRVRCAAHA